MNIEVTKDSVIILENSDTPHENEYKITECHFNFDDFTNSFQVKRAIFTILSTDEMYETDIINNKCDIPAEVLKHEYEIVKLGVYGFNIDENDDLANRFSPSYAEFTVPTGSYEEGALSPEIITPTQYDLYSQALQEGLEEVNDKLDEMNEALTEVDNLDIDATKSGNVSTVTITKKDGTTQEVEIEDGADGNDAKINGVNTLTIQEGENISISQSGSTMTISATGGSGGTSDYTDLTNKPSINNVTLSGNKTTADLGIVIPDLTDYVKNTDYATNSTGGVVKIDAYAITKSTNGNLMSSIYNYSTYSTASDNSFISKGTLENVLNEKIGNINTILATLTTPSNQGGNS